MPNRLTDIALALVGGAAVLPPAPDGHTPATPAPVPAGHAPAPAPAGHAPALAPVCDAPPPAATPMACACANPLGNPQPPAQLGTQPGSAKRRRVADLMMEAAGFSEIIPRWLAGSPEGTRIAHRIKVAQLAEQLRGLGP